MSHVAPAIWRGWRESRRQYFHPGNTKVHKATQVEFLYKMLRVEGPREFFVHHTEVRFPACYRYCQCGWGDSHITCIWSRYQGDWWPTCRSSGNGDREFLDITGSGTYLVDIFPILRYVPSWVPKSRRKLKYTDNFRRILSSFLLRRRLGPRSTIRETCHGSSAERHQGHGFLIHRLSIPNGIWRTASLIPVSEILDWWHLGLVECKSFLGRRPVPLSPMSKVLK